MYVQLYLTKTCAFIYITHTRTQANRLYCLHGAVDTTIFAWQAGWRLAAGGRRTKKPARVEPTAISSKMRSTSTKTHTHPNAYYIQSAYYGCVQNAYGYIIAFI